MDLEEIKRAIAFGTGNIVIPHDIFDRLSTESQRMVQSRLEDNRILNYSLEKHLLDLSHWDVVVLKWQKENQARVQQIRNDIQGNNDFVLDAIKNSIGGKQNE